MKTLPSLVRHIDFDWNILILYKEMINMKRIIAGFLLMLLLVVEPMSVIAAEGVLEGSEVHELVDSQTTELMEDQEANIENNEKEEQLPNDETDEELEEVNLNPDNDEEKRLEEETSSDEYPYIGYTEKTQGNIHLLYVQ